MQSQPNCSGIGGWAWSSCRTSSALQKQQPFYCTTTTNITCPRLLQQQETPQVWQETTLQTARQNQPAYWEETKLDVTGVVLTVELNQLAVHDKKPKVTTGSPYCCDSSGPCTHSQSKQVHQPHSCNLMTPYQLHKSPHPRGKCSQLAALWQSDDNASPHKCKEKCLHKKSKCWFIFPSFLLHPSLFSAPSHTQLCQASSLAANYFLKALHNRQLWITNQLGQSHAQSRTKTHTQLGWHSKACLVVES